MSDDYGYSATFFNSISGGSERSSAFLVPHLVRLLHPKSVVDIGCGRGLWLRDFPTLGVTDLAGVDGDYVDRDTLAIARDQFHVQNISLPFSLERQYDLALCLEVGEHVSPDASEMLIDNIVKHSATVLFSAAVPGQGGENHINEQPLDYWRGLFTKRGYVGFDAFRPLMRNRLQVEPWYRYNALLYVHQSIVGSLAPEILATCLVDGKAISDVSSPVFKLRKAILLNLPRPAVSVMARTKHFIRNLARS